MDRRREGEGEGKGWGKNDKRKKGARTSHSKTDKATFALTQTLQKNIIILTEKAAKGLTLLVHMG